MKPEDIYRLRFVSDPRVSRGRVAYVVARAKRDGEGYDSWIYVDGKRFTAGPKDTSPRWSPDGSMLAFVRGGEEGSAIYVINADGGEARKVIEDKVISNLKWSRDGKFLYYIGAVKEEGKSDVKRVKRIPFYFNGKGFLHDTRMHVFRVSLGGKKEQVTEGDFDVKNYDVGPDFIVYTRSESETRPWNTVSIYRVDKEGERKISARRGMVGPLSVSPSGDKVAVGYAPGDRTFHEYLKPCWLDADGGDYVPFVEEFEASMGNSLNTDVLFGTGQGFAWKEDGLYLIGTHRGSAELYRISDEKVEPVVGGEISVEGFDVEGDFLAYVSQTATRPPDLYVRRGKRTRNLTRFNRWVKVNAPERVTVESDGVTVEGWVLRGGEKGILEIHGGPQTAYGHAFMMEFHILNALGYTVFYCNPRGSDGYGEDFATCITGAYGDGDYRDVMAFARHVKEKYGLKSVGVTGGSYGGFMTNWIVGHTDFFRAAVTQRSISNFISFFGTSDIGFYFADVEVEGPPWRNLEEYWRRSPLAYVENVKTPLLIIHSEEDWRCPPEQAYQIFTALKYLEREVEMLLFPGENHDLSRSGKPKHRVERLKAIIDWFERYL